MKFDELNAEFVGLRNLLRTFVDENALGEITIQPPVGDDEASFLRLVAWSYAALFEAGRIAIPYLLALPAKSGVSDANAARRLVSDLRTSSFHNLELESNRNSEIYRRMSLWFIENCGANPPSDSVCWRKCFERLCDEVGKVLSRCKSVLESALSDADAERIKDDLRRRLERNWPAHEFDAIAVDAATRIGQRLDVRKFRDSRISAWREFLDAIPESDDPESQVTRLIERDVLAHFEDMLPFDGRDVMDALGLGPGPEVGEALRRARQLRRSGTTGRDELLELLSAECGSSGRPGQSQDAFPSDSLTAAT